MKIKDRLKNRVHKIVNWVRADKWRTAGAILWMYLFVRYKGVRDFFLGFFKLIFGTWTVMVGLVIAMMLFAIVAFIAMGIMVKVGILPKDYLANALTKAHNERVKREENKGNNEPEQV